MNKINIVALALAALILLGAGMIIGYTVKGEAQGQAALQNVSDGVGIPTSDIPVNIFGISDNNSTTIVTKNTAFILMLEENPTTGFQWNLTHTDGLTIFDDKFTPYNTSLIGAGGIHVWEIMASGHGSQSLNATYYRPWENATENESQFEMTVIIHDPDENGPVDDPGEDSPV
jgi:inhibitor of cysteine peptidase